MVYCAVLLVVTMIKIRKISEKIRCFCLPSDETLRRTWLNKIKREDLPANCNSIRHSC